MIKINHLNIFKQLLFFFMIGSLQMVFAQENTHIQLSGFEPFQARKQNASWVLVESLLAKHPKINGIQIPVVWAKPFEVLSQFQKEGRLPKVWIAFGEGTQTFQIEVHADNQRRDANDNLAQKPKTTEILLGGAKTLDHQWDQLKINALADRLTKLGYPTKISTEAGQYLCEEMLYQLLHFQKENQSKNSTKLQSVFFIHVPILGHLLEIDGKKKAVDQSYLLGFGEALLSTLGEMGVFGDVRILE